MISIKYHRKYYPWMDMVVVKLFGKIILAKYINYNHKECLNHYKLKE